MLGLRRTCLFFSGQPHASMAPIEPFGKMESHLVYTSCNVVMVPGKCVAICNNGSLVNLSRHASNWQYQLAHMLFCSLLCNLPGHRLHGVGGIPCFALVYSDEPRTCSSYVSLVNRYTSSFMSWPSIWPFCNAIECVGCLPHATKCPLFRCAIFHITQHQLLAVRAVRCSNAIDSVPAVHRSSELRCRS